MSIYVLFIYLCVYLLFNDKLGNFLLTFLSITKKPTQKTKNKKELTKTHGWLTELTDGSKIASDSESTSCPLFVVDLTCTTDGAFVIIKAAAGRVLHWNKYEAKYRHITLTYLVDPLSFNKLTSVSSPQVRVLFYFICLRLLIMYTNNIYNETVFKICLECSIVGQLWL